MQLSFELHLIQDAIASSERVRSMLGEKEEADTLRISGQVTQKISGQVRYENVSMAYSSGSPILKGISFSIEPGMNVALVGKTGSGKSTCLHLLPQLYPLLEGQISIDGIPLEQWDRQALREQIGIVSQDVVLFQGSLRENLLITQPKDATTDDATLLAVCGRSGLNQVLKKLPAGLDHQLQDGGSNFSMGERQLIAFTRILLRSPAILILDEATAHIDESCEALIQQAILELLKDRSCFIIAHRLSTIRHCDKILVFSDGKIIEEGKHDELMARQGHYANLVKRQMSHEHI